MIQVLSDNEHVRTRPQVYFGCSLEPVRNDKGEIIYSPAFEKLVEEVLNNAADYCTRSIRVSLLPDGTIVVTDDGPGLDGTVLVEGTNQHQVEIAFGRLRAGRNFQNAEQRVGQNGLGAKLTNLFSDPFVVETTSQSTTTVCHWEKGMEIMKRSIVKPKKPREKTGTRISFKPIYGAFQLTPGHPSILLFLQRRVVEMACSLRAHHPQKPTMTYQDQKITTNTFDKYARDVLRSDTVQCVVKDAKWHVCVFPRPIMSGKRKKRQPDVSFVNHAPTPDGGTHVRMVHDTLFTVVQQRLTTKKRPILLKELKETWGVVVSVSVENPSFNHQGKTKLMTRASELSPFSVSDHMVATVAKMMRERLDDEVAPSSKRRPTHQVPKMTHATGKAKNSTLIITEGDSAKSTAVGAFPLQQFGVFPVGGKVLNAARASSKTVTGNKEVQDIMQILNLVPNRVYTEKNVHTLRYQSILVLSDQDDDGLHIRGLIFNLFYVLWPSLLKIPGFMKYMKTPLVLASDGTEFFDVASANEYQQTHPRTKLKYYKGLGGWTTKDMRRMVASIEKYVVSMTGDPAVLAHAFGESTQWRKDMATRPRTAWAVASKTEECYDAFVEEQLSQYFMASNARSLSDEIDGFTPTRRKIVYYLLCQMVSKTHGAVKVSQFAAQIANTLHFHHGEASMIKTIIGLAGDYVGKSMPLLQDHGQFGTRRLGGKDAAAARYIFTQGRSVLSFLFRTEDIVVLEKCVDEGIEVEPPRLIPVVPWLLVGWPTGIGAGFASSILPRNLLDVIDCCLEERTVDSLVPYFPRFQGTVDGDERRSGRWATHGVFVCEENMLIVSELPIGMWTQKFKTILLSKDLTFTEHHTEHMVCFRIKHENPAQLATELPLTTYFTDQWVVNRDGCVVTTSIKEVFERHRSARLQTIQRRKHHDLDRLRRTIEEKEAWLAFLQAEMAGMFPLNATMAQCQAVCAEHKLRPQLLNRAISRADKTPRRMEQLRASIRALTEDHAALSAKTPEVLWRAELHELRAFWTKKRRSTTDDDDRSREE
jgi:DNA topoisomerase-2